MLPGTTGGPARCEGVCNRRQTLRPTITIHTSSVDLLMRMDTVIDEQKEDEETGRKGRAKHKKSGDRRVMLMCMNSVPKIETSV